MTDKKIEEILTMLVPWVVNLIYENYLLDEMAVSRIENLFLVGTKEHKAVAF